MSIFKLAVVMVICYFGYQHWEKTNKDAPNGITMFNNDSSKELSNGFISLAPFDDANKGKVVIFAPENCPEDGARRADDLADQLARKRIPFVRSSRANFTFSDASAANRAMSVMNGEIPIVFVNQRAKANPSFDEVIAEYDASRL